MSGDKSGNKQNSAHSIKLEGWILRYIWAHYTESLAAVRHGIEGGLKVSLFWLGLCSETNNMTYYHYSRRLNQIGIRL